MADLSTLGDLPVVRRLRSLIRERWGLEVGLAFPDGYVASHARGLVVPPGNSYCRGALSLAEGFRRCNRSVEESMAALASLPAGSIRALRVDTCHLGFPMLFVPLQKQQTFLGALFVGGFARADEAQSVLSSAKRNATALGLPIEGGDGGPVPILDAADYALLCDLVELIAEALLVWPGTVQALAEHGRPLGQDDGRIQFDSIVGRSPVMQELYRMIERVAPAESTVLITGEDGTGKELVANALHKRSRRSERPFVIRNCSAFNENLLESELFGHTKGSFTGADRDRRGVFELAHEGTLFLDEVGDTSPAMQVKLLRVLQNGTLIPVGGSAPISVDVRVIAATNRPLLDMVKAGTFRKDLYYRLNVINLHLPPLRDRPEDLPHLCEVFLDKLAARTQGPRKTLSAGVVEKIFAHDWPGNIRELQSEIERLYVLSGDSVLIAEDSLSPHLRMLDPQRRRRHTGGRNLADMVGELEREAISRALVRHHWNKKRVAEELGISRTTLLRKMELLDMVGPQVKTR
jgi:DNA-binding NtrC family response regulator